MSSRTASRDASPSVGADGKKKGGFLQRFERALGLGDDHPQSDYDTSSFHKSGVADSTHSSKAASNVVAAKGSQSPSYASTSTGSSRASTPTGAGLGSGVSSGSRSSAATPAYASSGSRSTPGAPLIAESDKILTNQNSQIDATTGTSRRSEIGAALGANDVRATRQGDVLQREYEQDEAASSHRTKPHTGYNTGASSSNNHKAAEAAGVVGAAGVANKLENRDNSRLQQQAPSRLQQQQQQQVPSTTGSSSSHLGRDAAAGAGVGALAAGAERRHHENKALDQHNHYEDSSLQRNLAAAGASAPVAAESDGSNAKDSHLGRDAAAGAGAGALAAGAARHHENKAVDSNRNSTAAAGSQDANRGYAPSNVSQKPTSNPVASNGPTDLQAQNTPFTSGVPSSTGNSSSHLGRDAAAGAGLGALAAGAERRHEQNATPSTPTAPRTSNTTAGAPISSQFSNNTTGGFSSGSKDRGFDHTLQPRVIGTTGTAADKYENYTHVGTAHVDCDDMHIKHGRFANWRPRDNNTTGSNSGY